jgi:hypothetical protein
MSKDRATTLRWGLAVGLLWGLFGVIALANPPAGASLPPLTPQAGPWMIIVSAFTGPTACELAHDLAREIQTEYRSAGVCLRPL